MATALVALDPAELEDTEWTFRATELAALLAWQRGTIDRAGFRRWLRAERWPEEDLDVLTTLLEHLFATERRMPGVRGLRGPGPGAVRTPAPARRGLAGGVRLRRAGRADASAGRAVAVPDVRRGGVTTESAVMVRRPSTTLQLDLFRREPICAGCRRPFSEVGAPASRVDRGDFCADCTKEARRWPA